MQHQGVSFSRTQRFSSFCGLIRGKFTEKLKRKATLSARPAWKNVGKTLSFPSETSTAKISSLENDFTLTHARNFLVDFSFFSLDPPQPRPNERPTDRRQEQKCKTSALSSLWAEKEMTFTVVVSPPPPPVSMSVALLHMDAPRRNSRRTESYHYIDARCPLGHRESAGKFAADFSCTEKFSHERSIVINILLIKRFFVQVPIK